MLKILAKSKCTLVDFLTKTILILMKIRQVVEDFKKSISEFESFEGIYQHIENINVDEIN